MFIEIVSLIKLKLPDINAMLCGKGSEENNLKKNILDLSFDNNIFLTGEIPHQQVLTVMQQAKVFLHTSSYEGFGAVCIEALHAGAHVISFCKPMSKHIQHWHIVDSKEEMVDKVLELLNNPKLDNTPILPFRITDTAKAIIKLFNYNNEAIE